MSLSQFEKLKKVIEEASAENREIDQLIEEFKGIRVEVPEDFTEANAAEAQANLNRLQELQAMIDERIGHEDAMVKQMAAELGLDLDRPVDEQIREFMAILDGNRRLGGTGRTQRSVGGHRKGSRRSRR